MSLVDNNILLLGEYPTHSTAEAWVVTNDNSDPFEESHNYTKWHTRLDALSN